MERTSLGKPIVPIVSEWSSLDMEEDTYQYQGTHLLLMQEGSD